jgi:hypothetical protein
MSLPKNCPRCHRACDIYDERSSGGMLEGSCTACLIAWHLCLGHQLSIQKSDIRASYGSDGYRCPNCLGNPNRTFQGPLTRYLSECPSCGGRIADRCNCMLKDMSCSKCPANWHVCKKYGRLVMAPHAPIDRATTHIQCECSKQIVF